MMNGMRVFNQDTARYRGMVFDTESGSNAAADQAADGLGAFGFDFSGVTTDGVTGMNLVDLATAAAVATTSSFSGFAIGSTPITVFASVQLPQGVIQPIHPLFETPWDISKLSIGQVVAAILQFGSQTQLNALSQGRIGLDFKNRDGVTGYVEFDFAVVTGGVPQNMATDAFQNTTLAGQHLTATKVAVPQFKTPVPFYMLSQINAYTDAAGVLHTITRPAVRTMDSVLTSTDGVMLMDYPNLYNLIVNGKGNLTEDKVWWIDGIYSLATGQRVMPPANRWPVPIGLGNIADIPATGTALTGPFLRGSAGGYCILQGVNGGPNFYDPINCKDPNTNATFVPVNSFTIRGALGHNEVVQPWAWNAYIAAMTVTPDGQDSSAGEHGGGGPV